MKVVNTGTYEARLGDLIRTVRDVVRRRIIMLTAVTAGVFALGVLATLSITPTYQGLTRVQIDPSRNPLARERGEVQAQLATEAIETEVARINSPEMSRAVVQKLNLINDPEFGGGPAQEGEAPLTPTQKLEVVTRNVNSKLNAGRDRLTYIIAIRFSSTDANKAAKISNAFATAYLDSKVGTKIGTAERQSQWYQKRQAELAAEVRIADEKVAEYQARAGIVRGSSNQQGTIVDQQIAPLSLQMASAESIAAEARAKEISARRLVASKQLEAVSDVRESATIQSLRQQRAVLLQTLEDVGGRYGERHPDFVKVRQQLGAVDEQLRIEANRVIRSLAADAEAAEARAESMRASMRGLEQKQAEIARASVIAASLQRDADGKHQAYEKMSQLALESRQAAQNSIAQAEIIDSAKPAAAPSSPNKPLLFLLSLLAGLGLGSAVIITQELMVSGLRSIEEAEAEVGAPLIAAIPHVKNEPRPADLLIKKPTSQFAEALRNARASIIGVRNTDRPKIIAVTSALPSEGKTTTALALARTMALNGDRTLIIDADVRRALLGRITDTDGKHPGLVELLQGKAQAKDVIHSSGIDNLDQILVRESYFTSENLFGNDLMPSLLEELSANYDAIILDLPPLVGLADGRFLAALADAVVLIVKWDSTPKHAVSSAAGWLKSDGANLVGTIFTMVDTSSQSVGAYYYYSKQYSGYYQQA
ncbi:polysaccharide biosynthesis tyrosine autokinase [Sphingomonas sp. R647]|uniref:GumC family protein n=1 Tax=Sphingomonas sp. R647 TaxID=2875233 RepID=UPI001CD300D9|nr:polysaccharide biosynthesis tyrosine autokinase [Sphingomonas sp. R647]MCA1196350.1 polysaccharide biosynthesis tyrosine autokinase [Sphingomonas sp. R647]